MKRMGKKVLEWSPIIGLFILIFMVVILSCINSHTSKIKSYDVIRHNIPPLTNDNFQAILDTLSIHSSFYGQALLHCKFLSADNLLSTNNNHSYQSLFASYHHDLGRGDKRFLGILKVINISVWSEIFYDDLEDQLCYYLYAYQLKSSLRCFDAFDKYEARNFFYDLEKTCYVYSQNIDKPYSNYNTWNTIPSLPILLNGY